MNARTVAAKTYPIALATAVGAWVYLWVTQGVKKR